MKHISVVPWELVEHLEWMFGYNDTCGRGRER